MTALKRHTLEGLIIIRYERWRGLGKVVAVRHWIEHNRASFTVDPPECRR